MTADDFHRVLGQHPQVHHLILLHAFERLQRVSASNKCMAARAKEISDEIRSRSQRDSPSLRHGSCRSVGRGARLTGGQSARASRSGGAAGGPRRGCRDGSPPSPSSPSSPLTVLQHSGRLDSLRDENDGAAAADATGALPGDSDGIAPIAAAAPASADVCAAGEEPSLPNGSPRPSRHSQRRPSRTASQLLSAPIRSVLRQRSASRCSALEPRLPPSALPPSALRRDSAAMAHERRAAGDRGGDRGDDAVNRNGASVHHELPSARAYLPSGIHLPPGAQPPGVLLAEELARAVQRRPPAATNFGASDLGAMAGMLPPAEGYLGADEISERRDVAAATAVAMLRAGVEPRAALDATAAPRCGTGPSPPYEQLATRHSRVAPLEIASSGEDREHELYVVSTRLE